RGIHRGVCGYHKAIDKDVAMFNSSTQGPEKLHMRAVCDNRGIPYTDDENILDSADVFIGDKKSDAKRAGQHGAKFIDIPDFSPEKLLAKSVSYPQTGGVEMNQSVSIPGMSRTVV